jgi:hypothetical protein
MIVQELETIYESRHKYTVEWAFKHANEVLLDNQHSQHFSHYLNKFLTVGNVFTIFEFIISMLLVLVVSEATHSSIELIDSRIYTTWVLLTFAFIKVFLENFLIKPALERIGWRLYRKTTNQLKNTLRNQD